jgi:hypothetical protein
LKIKDFTVEFPSPWTKRLEKHGNTSWEVDALDPSVLEQITRDSILERIDKDIFDKALEKEKNERDQLKELASKYK